MRAAGRSYLEIAAAGGGITATLGPTRAATDTELVVLMEARLDLALAGGTTTIEIKSGYDLTVAGELRLLRCIAAAQLRRTHRQRLVPTLLAHLIPPDRKDSRDAFVAELADDLIPQVASQQLATQGALTVAGAAAGEGNQALLAILGAGAQVGVLLPFSRTQEREADVLGLQYMARAGFDPRESIQLWKNMARAGGGGTPEFLSTHPSGSTRIQDLSNAMPEALALFEEARAAGRAPRCGARPR